MRHGSSISAKARAAWALALTLTLAAVAFASPASAAPPWDGTSFSPWLGTPGTTWCAGPAPGTNIANQQSAPLALIPQEAFKCLLDQFQAEATAAGVPQRMTVTTLPEKSAGGRDHYSVVVNALETPGQQLRYQRYQQIRALEKENPVAAQALLTSFAGEVKMPIFIEANIHGNEEEGADAMMQAIRDLVTRPRGTDPLLDKILDYSVLVVIPNMNPDGRFLGTRANSNGFDMNRDFLVQSQPEVRNNIRVQQQWLATNGLALHGYYNPTLNDGLTKPHNPGIEYDIFLKWNQRRLDDNEARLTAVPGAPGSTGYGMQRPVNDWCRFADVPQRPPGSGPPTFAPNCDAAGTPPGPAVAEGWDDWGPFYTQTYISLLGIDGSTVEMCSSSAPAPTYAANGRLIDGAGCGGEGRLGSKKAQYVVFYSSMDYWLTNRAQMMADQIEIYRRGVADAGRPRCCDDPLIASRGFDEANHNWMVEYPKAYVIPREGGGQRSNVEANRLAQWLLDNGIKVQTSNASFTYNGTTYPAGTYIVPMNQAFRGLALTSLSAGQDISSRIQDLYAPPGAWSHGLLWGADVVEVPRGDASFNPAATTITAPTPLNGGVRGGTTAAADFYSVTLRGPREVSAVLGLLRSGVTGELAEAPFTSTTGGATPAGSLIFPNTAANRAALQTAGQTAGIWFERNVGVTKPATTLVEKSPKVAILVNSTAVGTANPPNSDQSEALEAIFGPDAQFVSTVNGAGSLQNAATDPLAGFDVIYNTGQGYPSTANATARARLQAFFARGGGYIGTSVSGTNFTFLGASGAGLVDGFAQTSDGAFGGIALWRNVGGAASPITGAYPAQDTLYLPSNVTFFSTIPTGAIVDGRYLDTTTAMWVAGLWLDRDPNAAGAPIVVHGTTNNVARYMGLSTNPFSRQDAEREWTMIGQAALWTTLTDEANSDVSSPAPGGEYGHETYADACSGGTADICGVASGGPGPAIASVQVAVQQVSSGMWWNGTAFASSTPVYEAATGGANWSYTFPSSRFAEGDYIVRSRATTVGGNQELTPDETRFTFDATAPTITLTSPTNGAYGYGQQVNAEYSCADALAGIRSCTGPVESGAQINTTPGQHLFTVIAVDEAGNRTTQTVSYTVARLSCSMSLGASQLTAGQTRTLRIRVAAFGPNRTPAQPGRVSLSVRGAGVSKAATTNAGGLASIRLRPTRAGTLSVSASGGNVASCRKTLRVRAASGTAGTGSGGLTGRPR